MHDEPIYADEHDQDEGHKRFVEWYEKEHGKATFEFPVAPEDLQRHCKDLREGVFDNCMTDVADALELTSIGIARTQKFAEAVHAAYMHWHMKRRSSLKDVKQEQMIAEGCLEDMLIYLGVETIGTAYEPADLWKGKFNSLAKELGLSFTIE